MRKPVKQVFAAALLLCLAFAMVACSGKSKYVGTWVYDSAVKEGGTV